MTTQADIDAWFSDKEFVGMEPGRIDRIRSQAKTLAGIIVACCKPGHERDAAFHHLRACVMLCQNNLHNTIDVPSEEDASELRATLPAPPGLPRGLSG